MTQPEKNDFEEPSEYRKELIQKLEEASLKYKDVSLENPSEFEEARRVLGKLYADIMMEESKHQLASKIEEFNQRNRESFDAFVAQRPVKKEMKNTGANTAPNTNALTVHNVMWALDLERLQTHKFLVETFKKDLSTFDSLLEKQRIKKQEDGLFEDSTIKEAEYEEELSSTVIDFPALTHQPATNEDNKVEEPTVSVWTKIKNFFKGLLG